MAITEIQPTLPPEGAFTDPELNFIDESPRGFFPENQDSNWGWKRKVFTDQIQVAFDQLNLIFSEIFPQSSQEYLDEWEEAVGLPQNPTNKTLQLRRAMVLNRLRGGPFTRKQRREIVESYITATFGDPILLLPPGHPLTVGGSPLYNEVGDVSQLYMIVEAVELFTYTVRIKTAMAIDQLALERDLHWFTPAGIFIIFDYAWEGKFPTESGTGSDSISGRRISVADTGVAAEGVLYRGTDTGTSTDVATVGITRTETGTASAETATIPAKKFTVTDEIFSMDIAPVSNPVVTDTGQAFDDATQT